MKHAINELKMVLDIAKNNEPIQRAAGDVEQADYNAERVRDIEDALHLLQIWDDTKSPKSYSSDKFRADMDETSREENANGGPEDDDLGELDPDKACSVEDGGCESCQ